MSRLLFIYFQSILTLLLFPVLSCTPVFSFYFLYLFYFPCIAILRVDAVHLTSPSIPSDSFLVFQLALSSCSSTSRGVFSYFSTITLLFTTCGVNEDLITSPVCLFTSQKMMNSADNHTPIRSTAICHHSNAAHSPSPSLVCFQRTNLPAVSTQSPSRPGSTYK